MSSKQKLESSLVELAKKASQQAYAPYSKFPVGSAILTAKGVIFTACNIENISFGLTICAERAAVSRAIAESGPYLKIKKVVIYTPTDQPIAACGACRQVLREFGDDFEIISVCDSELRIEGSIDSFLPYSPDIRL